MVTLWVNSVFLSLLIANEGLHCWLFLVRYSHLYGVELSSSYVLFRFVGPSGGWWPRFSLACHFFASGLSSPGLLGCLTLCLRYAAWLCLWLCTHSLLDLGIRGLFACPSPSSMLWLCECRCVLFSPMVHTLRDGVKASLSSIGMKVSCVFPFPLGCFFFLSLPFGM